MEVNHPVKEAQNLKVNQMEKEIQQG